MDQNSQQVNFSFDFVIPADDILRRAKEATSSPDEHLRAVGKALLDVTQEANLIRNNLAADADVDLAPYFDFWFFDAVAAANVLLKSNDANSSDLAECLIAQEAAIIKSKESFLGEMKRAGVHRNL